MRILTLGNWHGMGSCSEYATAFEQLGHTVLRVGAPFTWEDAERWAHDLAQHEWMTDAEAKAYAYTVLAESPHVDLPTEKGAMLETLPEADALITFYAYGETPRLPARSLLPTAFVIGDTHTAAASERTTLRAWASEERQLFVQYRRADLAWFDHPSKHWLPAAADPAIWFPTESPKDIDVLFVGATHAGVHQQRVALLRYLKAKLGEQRVVVKHAYGAQANALMNRAKVVFNCSLAGDLNRRVAESLMAGANLVTDQVDGLADLGWSAFCQTYDREDARSVLEAVQDALATPPSAALRQAWVALLRANHTYQARAQEVLRAMGVEKNDDPSSSGRNRLDGDRNLGCVDDGAHSRGPARRDTTLPGICDNRPVAGQSSGRLLSPVSSSVTPPTVSIIIPAWNHWTDATKPLLERLTPVPLLPDDAVEILVIDDGSTDDTADRTNFTYCCGGAMVYHKTNGGFASACNFGAKLATGKYLVFLNNDTLPQPGWLSPLVAQLEAGAGIVGARMVDPLAPGDHLTGGFATQSAGLASDSEGRWSNLNFLQDDVPYEVAAVTGACLGIARETFWKLGGFSQTFVNGVEDCDLALRAKLFGYSIFVVPESVIPHREGTTRFAEGMAHVEENQQRLQARWGTAGTTLPAADPQRRDNGSRGDVADRPAPSAAPAPDGIELVWVGPTDVATGGSLAVINSAVVAELRKQGWPMDVREAWV